jgi:hypothetical protein
MDISVYGFSLHLHWAVAVAIPVCSLLKVIFQLLLEE